MKRGSEKQLRKESHSDSDDEDSNVAGTWEKASEEEMAKRRVIKRVKPRESAMKTQPIEALSNSSNQFSANPFGDFKGLTSDKSSSVLSAAPQKVNAFIAPIVGSASASNGSTFDFSKNTVSNTAPAFDKEFSSFAKFASNQSSAKVVQSKDLGATGPGTKAQENTYGGKMLQLNEAFLTWLQHQKTHSPMDLWNKGMEDYLQHAERLGREFCVAPANPSKHENADKVPVNINSDKVPDNIINIKKPTEVSAIPPNKPLFAPIVPTPPVATAPATAFIFGGAEGSAGFSWGKNENSTAPFTSSFSLAPNASSTLPLPTFGLKFPTPAVPPTTQAFSFNVAKGNDKPDAKGHQDDGDDDDGGESEGEPMLEPEIILRDENDKDEILYQTDCILRRLDMKAEPKPEWKDVGKGSLRVTYDPNTGVRRILVREKTMGKVTLNASFFASQKFEKKGKNSIQFAAVVPDPSPEAAAGATSLNTFLLKTNENETDKAIAALNSARDSKK